MTPKKYAQNFHTPKNIQLSESQIEIKNFEPNKNSLSLGMYENIRVPLPPMVDRWTQY